VPNNNTQRGSMLMDWSTALSLAATTAMVAVPGLRTFVHESQRSAVVNELQLDVRRAARTANETGQAVTLCAKLARSQRCAEHGNWSDGWIAFVDADGNGRMEAGEARLQLWQRSNPHVGMGVAAEPATITFRPFYARPFLGTTEAQVTVWDRAGHGGARTVAVDGSGVPVLSEVRWPAGAGDAP
jgi:type IV fimbrial biogenesis protein FimT